MPQRGTTAPIDSRPAQPATPVDKTDATPSQPARANTKTIGINISFGTRPQLPSKTAIVSYIRQLLFTKKGIIIASITIVLVVGAIVAGSLIHQQNVAKDSSEKKDPNQIIENLEYQTILPDSKSISSLGGWKRVSPPKADPVYAYVDTINGVAISVSQQPLPKSFKGNTDDQIAELAKKFNATTKIEADDTKVYIGTSAKGPQSVIFTKDYLLILIKSLKKIDNTSWTTYIKSLN
jgi:hypothetical protein